MQFSEETDARLERAAGRVEHLQTGRRTRFASIYDLLACIVALLAAHDSAPGKPRGRARRKSLGRRAKAQDDAAPLP